MYIDYHMHTSFSDDSIFEMEDEIIQSIHIGLEEICFCEHVDYGVKNLDNCNYDAYKNRYQELKEKYKDQINIKFGIEFGVQTHTIPEFQRDANEQPFDFIILSCHQVENQEFWTQEFQIARTQEEYNLRYYEEILAVMKDFKDYSVLGHLDLIRRYDREGDFPFEKIKPIVTEILTLAIKDGKGIEVNTSSRRYNIEGTTPSIDILKLYKELGGTILTIGSDAHKKAHVGEDIKETMVLLKELGFKEIYTFEKRKPIAHAL